MWPPLFRRASAEAKVSFFLFHLACLSGLGFVELSETTHHSDSPNWRSRLSVGGLLLQLDELLMFPCHGVVVGDCPDR